ncbi:MAG: hypothetical protein N4A63_13300 [Vallitalea sp.]|nr:hypothetical protein [Vallitalea sp.]
MKFSKKILNYAAWITLLLTYLLPYQSTDGFATGFGYPISFLTVYDTKINRSLINTININILSFIADIGAIYIVIYLAYKISVKVKSTKMINKNKII